jgi:hypothetical protein
MKLSLKKLRSFVIEEAKNFGKTIQPEDAEVVEVDADEIGDTLEKPVDFYDESEKASEKLAKKAKLANKMCAEEKRLLLRLKQLREARKRLVRDVVGVK